MSEHNEAPARESVAGMNGPDGPFLRLFKDRRIAFLAIGAINTGVGFLWFLLFSFLVDSWWPGAVWSDIPVLLCAQIMASLSAFVFYRRLVFRVRGNVLVDFARFQLVYLVTFAINLVALPLMTQVLGWHRIPSQLLYTIVIAVASYFGHANFSFRRKKEPIT